MLNEPQSYIQVQQRDRVMEICINRPDKKNALNLVMYQAISEAITCAVESADIRAILLTGANGCFTSGNDLAVFADPKILLSKDNPIFQFMKVLLNCPKPVLASVEGVAVGIGTTLLLHCDFVFVSPQAQFKLPFSALGLTPEYGSSWLLPRLVGTAKANEWLLLGAGISAKEGLEAGFVNAIDDNPLDLARAHAKAIAQMAPEAIRQSKALLRAPIKAKLEEVIEQELEAFMTALKGPEFAEAAKAFFEKRAPDFSQFT